MKKPVKISQKTISAVLNSDLAKTLLVEKIRKWHANNLITKNQADDIINFESKNW